jgi:hypothetical protein
MIDNGNDVYERSRPGPEDRPDIDDVHSIHGCTGVRDGCGNVVDSQKELQTVVQPKIVI